MTEMYQLNPSFLTCPPFYNCLSRQSVKNYFNGFRFKKTQLKYGPILFPRPVTVNRSKSLFLFNVYFKDFFYVERHMH